MAIRTTTPERAALGAVPGAYTLRLPRYRPALLNELIGSRHWAKAARLKRRDRKAIAGYAALQGVPKAEGRRRVSVVLPGPRTGRLPDPDSWQKSTLDALVAAGLLVDDSGKWCEVGPATFERGGTDTTITLEDIDR